MCLCVPLSLETGSTTRHVLCGRGDGHCIRPTPSPRAVNPIHLSVSLARSLAQIVGCYYSWKITPRYDAFVERYHGYKGVARTKDLMRPGKPVGGFTVGRRSDLDTTDVQVEVEVELELDHT